MSYLQQFDSIGEFLTHMEHSKYANRRGFHGETMPQALRMAREGNPKHNAEIDSLVERVSCNLPTYTDEWMPSVSGPLPVVPAYLAGLPDNMLRCDRREVSGVPMRVFVSVCLSAGCEARVIAKRGIALNALLQQLSQRRPTELWIYLDVGCRDEGIVSPVIRVQSMPLDTSTLTAALTDEMFLRVLMFGFVHGHYNWRGTWAWGDPPTSARAQRLTREALGAAPTDLVIVGAFLSESDLIISDPTAWVQQQIDMTEKLIAEQEGTV